MEFLTRFDNYFLTTFGLLVIPLVLSLIFSYKNISLTNSIINILGEIKIGSKLMVVLVLGLIFYLFYGLPATIGFLIGGILATKILFFNQLFKNVKNETDTQISKILFSTSLILIATLLTQYFLKDLAGLLGLGFGLIFINFWDMLSNAINLPKLIESTFKFKLTSSKNTILDKLVGEVKHQATDNVLTSVVSLLSILTVLIVSDFLNDLKFNLYFPLSLIASLLIILSLIYRLFLKSPKVSEASQKQAIASMVILGGVSFYYLAEIFLKGNGLFDSLSIFYVGIFSILLILLIISISNKIVQKSYTITYSLQQLLAPLIIFSLLSILSGYLAAGFGMMVSSIAAFLVLSLFSLFKDLRNQHNFQLLLSFTTALLLMTTLFGLTQKISQTLSLTITDPFIFAGLTLSIVILLSIFIRIHNTDKTDITDADLKPVLKMKDDEVLDVFSRLLRKSDNSLFVIVTLMLGIIFFVFIFGVTSIVGFVIGLFLLGLIGGTYLTSRIDFTDGSNQDMVSTSFLISIELALFIAILSLIINNYS